MHRSRPCALAVLLLAASAGASAQIVGERLDGPDSAYAESLQRILTSWPARRFQADAPRGVELTCIATPDEESYIGILRRTLIHASLSAVEEVLDDLGHYKDLFPGTVDVRVVPGSRSGSRFATSWEQRVPVPFLPNVKYELSHLVDKTIPGRAVYRYKLRHGELLKASDGMVVAESVGVRTTEFTEYGFFHPRSGPLPASVVWRESVRGAYLGNMAIKLKAENPDWTYERIATEAERRLASEAAHVDRCLAARHATALRADLPYGTAVLR